MVVVGVGPGWTEECSSWLSKVLQLVGISFWNASIPLTPLMALSLMVRCNKDCTADHLVLYSKAARRSESGACMS